MSFADELKSFVAQASGIMKHITPTQKPPARFTLSMWT